MRVCDRDNIFLCNLGVKNGAESGQKRLQTGAVINLTLHTHVETNIKQLRESVQRWKLGDG